MTTAYILLRGQWRIRFAAVDRFFALLFVSRPRKPQRPHRSAPSNRHPPANVNAGWPGQCSNVSRWNVAVAAAGSGGTSQGFVGGSDDGLQALPRRGLKSRILHHSTNQGSESTWTFLWHFIIYYYYFSAVLYYWHFPVQLVFRFTEIFEMRADDIRRRQMDPNFTDSFLFLLPSRWYRRKRSNGNNIRPPFVPPSELHTVIYFFSFRLLSEPSIICAWISFKMNPTIE